MRILFSALLAVFFLAACLDEAESKNDAAEAATSAAASTAALLESICQSGTFPGGKAIDTTGHAYDKVCRMQKLSGINIKGVDAVYLCSSELFLNEPTQNGDQKYFSAQEVKTILGPAAEKATLLAAHGFIGKRFAVLILQAGDKSSLISTQEQLAAQPVTLQSAEAALAWAYLSGALGRGMADGYAPKALCGAELVEGSTGWSLNQAEVFENCRPKELRDIRITRQGQVSILNKTVKTDSAALCID